MPGFPPILTYSRLFSPLGDNFFRPTPRTAGQPAPKTVESSEPLSSKKDFLPNEPKFELPDGNLRQFKVNRANLRLQALRVPIIRPSIPSPRCPARPMVTHHLSGGKTAISIRVPTRRQIPPQGHTLVRTPHSAFRTQLLYRIISHPDNQAPRAETLGRVTVNNGKLCRFFSAILPCCLRVLVVNPAHLCCFVVCGISSNVKP